MSDQSTFERDFRQRTQWAVGIAAVVLGLIVICDGHHMWRMMAKFPVVATILLFLLTQIVTLGLKYWDEAVLKIRITEGLFDEIDRNLEINAKGNLSPESVQMLKDAIVRDKKVRPMIVVVYQDNFYKGILKDLPLISARKLKAVNDFYFCILQLKAVADAIERETFFLMTIPGRRSMFDDLLEAYLETVRAGEAAKAALQEKAGRSRFFP